jgi:hypothetical protein
MTDQLRETAHAYLRRYDHYICAHVSLIEQKKQEREDREKREVRGASIGRYEGNQWVTWADPPTDWTAHEEQIEWHRQETLRLGYSLAGLLEVEGRHDLAIMAQKSNKYVQSRQFQNFQNMMLLVDAELSLFLCFDEQPSQEIDLPHKKQSNSTPAAKRKKNIQGLMMRLLSARPETIDWDSEDWASELGCTSAAVRQTDAWKKYIPSLRRMRQFTPDQIIEIFGTIKQSLV